jgi:hypothetical protein
MQKATLLWLASALVAANPAPSALAGLEGRPSGDPNAVGGASLKREKAAAIPLNQIGTLAGKQYSGDGLSVTTTTDGARLRCVFQKLEGQATGEALWLRSTVKGAPSEGFRLMAVSVGRQDGAGSEAEGQVEVADQMARSSAHPPVCER